VGWLVSGVIFGPHHQPKAFVRRNAVFSFGGHCIGRIETGFIRDRKGDAVAFMDGAKNGPPVPIPEFPPLKPILPIPPSTPVPSEAPVSPPASNAWSVLDWEQFLS
jgi:hypothetical protein